MDKSEILEKLSEELSNTDWVEDQFLLYGGHNNAISITIIDEDGDIHEFK